MEESRGDEKASGDGEPTAEELEEGDARPGGDDEPGAFDNAAGKMSDQAAPLLEGKAAATPAGPLPVSSLAGIAAFLGVFLVVFFAFWAWLGGIGIVLGMIVGAALGFGAVKLLADRARS